MRGGRCRRGWYCCAGGRGSPEHDMYMYNVTNTHDEGGGHQQGGGGGNPEMQVRPEKEEVKTYWPPKKGKASAFPNYFMNFACEQCEQ